MFQLIPKLWNWKLSNWKPQNLDQKLKPMSFFFFFFPWQNKSPKSKVHDYIKNLPKLELSKGSDKPRTGQQFRLFFHVLQWWSVNKI
jgi:hypothetical protein